MKDVERPFEASLRLLNAPGDSSFKHFNRRAIIRRDAPLTAGQSSKGCNCCRCSAPQVGPFGHC